MFADYFLTVVGAILKEKKYDLHFKTKYYELNPVWQKHIEQKKWFNPKHILLTLAISSILIFLTEIGSLPEPFPQVFLGVILSVFAMLIGRHLSNLMIFVYIGRRPDEISGQVTMSHPLILWLSLFQYLVGIIPLVLILVFTRSSFVLGAVIGSVLLILTHLRWLRKYRKKANQKSNDINLCETK